MGRWGEAIKAYDAGLKMEPGSSMLHAGREDALKRLAHAGGEWRVIGDRTMAMEMQASLFTTPTLVSLAPGGGICVVDREQKVVHVLNANAQVRCSLNTKQEVNRAGLFGEVRGLACDGRFVYCTDDIRCRVIKCSASDGSLVATKGRSGAEEGNFEAPWGLALADTSTAHGEPDATLFVADAKGHRITALASEDLSFRFRFGRWGFGIGELNRPHGIAACGTTLVVADTGNRRVCVFDLTGAFLRWFGKDGFESPFDAGPMHVAMGAEHLFVLEEPSQPSDEPKEVLPIRPGAHIHCLHPISGAVLRPPLLPPLSLDDDRRGMLTGMAVVHDELFVSSAYGSVLALPRSPAQDICR